MSYVVATGKDSVDLHVHIQPKASKTRICGLHDGRLKVAVNAPPVDGKANKAVVAYLRKILGIPARDVVIKSGHQSRQKIITIRSLKEKEVKTMIAPFLANL